MFYVDHPLARRHADQLPHHPQQRDSHAPARRSSGCRRTAYEQPAQEGGLQPASARWRSSRTTSTASRTWTQLPGALFVIEPKQRGDRRHRGQPAEDPGHRRRGHQLRSGPRSTTRSRATTTPSGRSGSSRRGSPTPFSTGCTPRRGAARRRRPGGRVAAAHPGAVDDGGGVRRRFVGLDRRKLAAGRRAPRAGPGGSGARRPPDG